MIDRIFFKSLWNRVNIRGVTIIELCVAMAMTAVIVGVVFAAWNNFNRHVINHRRKSMLHGEIRQISKSIASQVRRSPGVLAWHSNGITYLSPNNNDTIVYEYYADKLLKNDAPVPVISQGAYISDFNVEEVEQCKENTDVTLLSITTTMADDFSNQMTISSTVAVKVTGDQEEEEELSGWNF